MQWRRWLLISFQIEKQKDYSRIIQNDFFLKSGCLGIKLYKPVHVELGLKSDAVDQDAADQGVIGQNAADLDAVALGVVVPDAVVLDAVVLDAVVDQDAVVVDQDVVVVG